jgi:hypothetical protein
MIRNESVRFGRHIDIEVNYKILWLEIPKLVQILHYLACFQRGLFGGNFEQKHPWSFRGSWNILFINFIKTCRCIHNNMNQPMLNQCLIF